MKNLLTLLLLGLKGRFAVHRRRNAYYITALHCSGLTVYVAFVCVLYSFGRVVTILARFCRARLTINCVLTQLTAASVHFVASDNHYIVATSAVEHQTESSVLYILIIITAAAVQGTHSFRVFPMHFHN